MRMTAYAVSSQVNSPHDELCETPKRAECFHGLRIECDAFQLNECSLYCNYTRIGEQML